MGLGLDFSTYYVRSITASQVQALRAAGYGQMFLGYDSAPYSAAVKDAMLSGGFEWTCAYRFLYHSLNPATQVDDVVAGINASTVKPRYLVLDIEESKTDTGPTAAQITQAVARVESYGIVPGAATEPAVYTRYGYWTQYLASFTLPADHGWKLIAAQWNGAEDLNVLLYGNWTQALIIGHQFSGDITVDGIDLDQDWFIDAAPQPAPGPDVPDAITRIQRAQDELNNALANLRT